MSVRVGGLVPLTTVDFPGCLAAVVFCQGCGWRCRYCHNPHLLTKDAAVAFDWPATLDFLSSRRGLLDGVVFSGGEPLLQPELAKAITQVWTMGFKVGLHTAGCLPARFVQVLSLVDWVGFDVKAPFADYEKITGVANSGAMAKASLELLIASGKAFQLRTTYDEQILSAGDLRRLVWDLAEFGVEDQLIIQQCRSLRHH